MGLFPIIFVNFKTRAGLSIPLDWRRAALLNVFFWVISKIDVELKNGALKLLRVDSFPV